MNQVTCVLLWISKTMDISAAEYGTYEALQSNRKQQKLSEIRMLPDIKMCLLPHNLKMSHNTGQTVSTGAIQICRVDTYPERMENNRLSLVGMYSYSEDLLS